MPPILVPPQGRLCSRTTCSSRESAFSSPSLEVDPRKKLFAIASCESEAVERLACKQVCHSGEITRAELIFPATERTSGLAYRFVSVWIFGLSHLCNDPVFVDWRLQHIKCLTFNFLRLKRSKVCRVHARYHSSEANVDAIADSCILCFVTPQTSR